MTAETVIAAELPDRIKGRIKAAIAETSRCRCGKSLNGLLYKAAVHEPNGGAPLVLLCLDCAAERAPEECWSFPSPCAACSRRFRTLISTRDRRARAKGVQLAVRSSKFLTCSPECRDLAELIAEWAARRLPPKDCEFCGKEFPPKRRDAKTCCHEHGCALWRQEGRLRRERAAEAKALLVREQRRRRAEKEELEHDAIPDEPCQCGARWQPPDDHGLVTCWNGHMTPGVYRLAAGLAQGGPAAA